MGEDGETKKVHIIQMNIKAVPMPPPPLDPQYQQKTAQVTNGDLAILVSVLDKKTLTMASIVVPDTVVLAPERNTPAVAPFILYIDVPSPLPPPPLLTYAAYVPPSILPPLTPEPLPLIAPTLPPSDLVADK